LLIFETEIYPIKINMGNITKAILGGVVSKRSKKPEFAGIPTRITHAMMPIITALWSGQ